MSDGEPGPRSQRARSYLGGCVAALIAIVLVGLATQADGRVVFDETPLLDGPGWVLGWNTTRDHCRRAPLLRAERAEQRSIHGLQTLRRTADGRYGFWIDEYPVWDRFTWWHPAYQAFCGPFLGCGVP